jgi:hypothetical protein
MYPASDTIIVTETGEVDLDDLRALKSPLPVLYPFKYFFIKPYHSDTAFF